MAIDGSARHLRQQSLQSNHAEDITSYSLSMIEGRLDTSHKIIKQGELIITYCDFDREMTAAAVDLIIDKNIKMKCLSDDTCNNHNNKKKVI